MNTRTLKHILVGNALALVLCSGGCMQLPVPKTSIAFEPATRSLDIRSPKDVEIGKIDLMVEGTNFTLTVEQYKSSNPVEVIRAAASAQAAQVQAGQQALDRVIAAAASGAK